MSKIVITSNVNHNQQVIVSTDGKDQALPSSAGKALVVKKTASGKISAVNGTTTGIVHDNPA